jgi:hypothetical protein
MMSVAIPDIKLESISEENEPVSSNSGSHFRNLNQTVSKSIAFLPNQEWKLSDNLLKVALKDLTWSPCCKSKVYTSFVLPGVEMTSIDCLSEFQYIEKLDVHDNKLISR